MAGDVLAEDWKARPYWWELAPRPDWPEVTLPAEGDVAIVGSGCAGMSCALHLARAGRNVLILKAKSWKPKSRPWFPPLVQRWYQWRDARAR